MGIIGYVVVVGHLCASGLIWVIAMSESKFVAALCAGWIAFAVATVTMFATPHQTPRAVISGTIYESDGLTLTVGQGGKDWKIVFLNVDGESEQPSRIEYLGSTYRAEFDLRRIKSPVVTMCLFDGPKNDCAMERMVLSAKTPIHLDVAFWPKQAK